ncbi:MAG: DUF2262 domain-containing protein [Coriobacteriales bacterium]|jgi:hypothetical protein
MGLFSKKKKDDMTDELLVGNAKFTYDSKLGFYSGELNVWERKTKILLLIKNKEENTGNVVLEKINWLNTHREKILQSFFEEYDEFTDAVNEMIEDGNFDTDKKISQSELAEAIFVNNALIRVNGNETDLSIDLGAEPDYFMGHLASVEIDCENKVEVGGLNG